MGPAQSDPTVQQHLDAVEANIVFADYLRASGRSDPTTVGWGITCLFYAAVHAVRAYLLAKHGRRVSAHIDMVRLLAEFPELRRSQTNYDYLKQQSESARYYLNSHFTWKDWEFMKSKAAQVDKCWRDPARRAVAK